MTDHLFSKGPIHAYLSHHQRQLIEEINALAPDAILLMNLLDRNKVETEVGSLLLQ